MALHGGDEGPHEGVLSDLGEGGDGEVVGFDGGGEVRVRVRVLEVGPVEEAVGEDAGVLEAREDLLGDGGGEVEVGLGEGLFEEGGWGSEDEVGDEGDWVAGGERWSPERLRSGGFEHGDEGNGGGDAFLSINSKSVLFESLMLEG